MGALGPVELQSGVGLVSLPKEEDLQGAAVAILRLQETYNLNASQLVRGAILEGQSTTAGEQVFNFEKNI